MTNETNRGGQKKGGSGNQSTQHQGVRPGSTTQNKAQRQKQAEKTGKSRVVNPKSGVDE